MDTTKRDEIEELLRAGEVPWVEIARRCGRTRSRVHQIAKAIGARPPKQEKGTTFCVWLTAEQRSALDAFCASHGKTRSSVLRAIITDWIKQQGA
ncbi:MAG: hypothetical protein M3315_11930 [Actinomycetota bacterium]|nr:hypothetical protein [Actinomycetota bacterium]